MSIYGRAVTSGNSQIEPVAYLLLNARSTCTDVYATCGARIVHGAYINSQWYFGLTTLGTWTVYATYNGLTKTTSIDASTQYEIYTTSLQWTYYISCIGFTRYSNTYGFTFDYKLAGVSQTGSCYGTTVEIESDVNNNITIKGFGTYASSTSSAGIYLYGTLVTTNSSYTFAPTKDASIKIDATSGLKIYIT